MKSELSAEQKLDLTINRIGTPFKSLTIDINRPPDPNFKAKPNLASIESQGRRRFHGAFTGGFSAGYFNTVGSEEGFTPSQFRSSRLKKAERKNYLPQDFMDQEDMNTLTQAGDLVAKQNPQHKDGFSSIFKADLNQTILSKGFELLKAMGWKEGRGMGPRRSRFEGKTAERDETLLGFSAPAEDIKPIEFEPKKDFCGLGFDLSEVSSTTDKWLLGSSRDGLKSVCVERKMSADNVNKSTSSFGLSVLEDFDALDDVYAGDHMDNYDKEITLDTLEPPEKVNQIKARRETHIRYVKAKASQSKNAFLPSKIGRIRVPKWFDGKHKFEIPGMQLTRDMKQFGAKALSKRALVPKEPRRNSKLNASKRGELLGETPIQKLPVSLKSAFSEGKVMSSSDSLRLPAGISFHKKQADPFEKLRRRFSDKKKQTRFHKFLNKELGFKAIKVSRFDEDIFNKESVDLKEENKEFEKLLNSFTENNREHSIIKKRDELIKKRSIKEKKVYRTTSDWQPESLLCKRFNVPDPYLEMAKKMGIDPKNKISLDSVEKEEKEGLESDQAVPETEKVPMELLKAIFSDSEGDELSEDDKRRSDDRKRNRRGEIKYSSYRK